MSVIQTNEMLGKQPVVNPDEAGALFEITIKVDPAVTPIASGDFLQLMQIPADCVLVNVSLGTPTTLGAVTVAAGYADALATTTLATTFIAAGTITSTAKVTANSLTMADTPISNPTKDQKILALQFGGASLAAVMYATVTYRAARYGK